LAKDFLVTDFEFTQYTKRIGRPRGFFPEIIEIGAVLLDGTTYKFKGKMQNFVKPEFYPKQAKEALDFCMITPQDMKKAILFTAMLEGMQKLYVPGNTWFVAWGNEDYHVVDEGCQKRNIDNPVLYDDYLDLAEAYKIMKGDNYTTGLKKATEEQEVATGGLWHTAYDDASNTAKLLTKLLKDGWTVEKYHADAEARRLEQERLAKEKHDAWLARMQQEQ
jgi:inhibitor of KinA sporulation pathway (predicted exonuclease)